MENLPLNANRHLRFQKCLPTENSQSEGKITNRRSGVNPSFLGLGMGKSRRYRNRRLGEFLKELDMTEGRSTGIPKILQAMEANGSPSPVFDFDEDHSYFMCRLPVHPAVEAQSTDPVVQSPTQLTDPVTHPRAQSGAQEAQVALSDTEKKMLLACSKGATDAQTLAKAAGYASRTGNVKRALEKLLSEKMIEMTIPDKPTSSKQKYRLMPKGFQCLETLAPREEI